MNHGSGAFVTAAVLGVFYLYPLDAHPYQDQTNTWSAITDETCPPYPV